MTINTDRLIQIVFFLSSLACVSAVAQGIDHWEAIILANDIWRYHPGTGEPPSNWKEMSFQDGTWQSGAGGIGYGDGDDQTIISNTISLFMRKEFEIVDCNDIGLLRLFADYDDAFVAYLNGIEVARSNIGEVGVPPQYLETATENHEAELYRGGQPDQFELDFDALQSVLCEGTNVLSVQVHNVNLNSSDLSSNIFLIAGMTSQLNQYRPVPVWFIEPFVNSNLPILVIETDGQSIPDEPKIDAHLGIIDNGPNAINSLTDPLNGYDGLIGIEIKGSSSQQFPKKNFAFETRMGNGENLNVELLGMPEENDWVLHGPYSDKSLLRNVLGYHLGELTGRYAPRTRFCELMINGSYEGLYVLTEFLKRDKNRVDIAKLTTEDIEGDELTGGYLLSIDRNEGEESGWSSPFTNAVFYRYKDPKRDELLPVQKDYIKNYITDFERDILDDNSIEMIENYIDVDSWVDYWIATEICKHIDGFKFSFYMYKKKDSNGGKIHFGPLWDLNLAFGNFDFGEDPGPEGWSYEWANTGFLWPRWVIDLTENEEVQNRIHCRWDELRENELATDNLISFLDEQSNLTSSARNRNFERWNILGQYIWPNFYVGQTYAEEFSYLETWLIERLNWMDQNMVGICEPTSVNTFVQDTINILLFPNPTNGSFFIKSDVTNPKIQKMEVRDINGRVVAEIARPNINQAFELMLEKPGIYIVSILVSSRWMNRKLVIFN
jgi:hypothetical protein